MNKALAVYVAQCSTQLPTVSEYLVECELFLHLPDATTAILQVTTGHVLEDQVLESIRSSSVVQTDEMSVCASLSESVNFTGRCVGVAIRGLRFHQGKSYVAAEQLIPSEVGALPLSLAE